jgi:hypothetical protein
MIWGWGAQFLPHAALRPLVQAQDATMRRHHEAISELPVTVGEQKKQRSSSRYLSVCWDNTKSAWVTHLWDKQAQRQQNIGRYACDGRRA